MLLVVVSDLIAGVETAGHRVLVDVESSKSQSYLVLQLWSEPLLDHVVTALDVQVLECH